jgi:hypothetical protein
MRAMRASSRSTRRYNVWLDEHVCRIYS